MELFIYKKAGQMAQIEIMVLKIISEDKKLQCRYPISKKAQVVTDEEALEAFDLLSREEGIIPALESAHAVAEVIKLAPKMKKSQILLMNLSGRGDKDVQQIARMRGIPL